jgi:hypothetical protein
MPQLTFPGLLTNVAPQEFRLDIQNFTTAYNISDKGRFDFVKRATDPAYLENTNYIKFTLDSSGNFQKPATWTGRRASPWQIAGSHRPHSPRAQCRFRHPFRP